MQKLHVAWTLKIARAPVDPSFNLNSNNNMQ